MVFQALDKWMLDIELKKNPTPRERRQHVKLERIRNETYSRYLNQQAVWDSTGMHSNQCNAPMHCKERAMTPFQRAMSSFSEALKTL